MTTGRSRCPCPTSAPPWIASWHRSRRWTFAALAKQCLDTYPPKPLDLAQLAHQLGVSDAHLRRLFRAAHGRTPRRYLLESRIQQAATLLCTTSDRIESIAADVGFPSPTRFGQAFRAVMSITPSEYRAWARARNA